MLDAASLSNAKLFNISRIRTNLIAKSETVWRKNLVEFPQLETYPGMAMTEKTHIWTGYDKKYLYFLFECRESNMSGLVVDQTKHIGEKTRMSPFMCGDDFVEIYLDVACDRRSYLHYLVNAAGEVFTESGIGDECTLETNIKWKSPKLFSETEHDRDRWIVKLAIPFADTGITISTGMLCGLNIQRHQASKGEISFWNSDTLAWTTQWTSTIVHIPRYFGVIVFDSLSESVIYRARQIADKLDDDRNEKTHTYRDKIEQIISGVGASVNEKKWRDYIEQLENIYYDFVTKKDACTTAEKSLARNTMRPDLWKVTSPGRWKLPILKDRDFWLLLQPLWHKPGLSDEGFVQEAGMHINIDSFGRRYAAAVREIEAYGSDNGQNLATEAAAIAEDGTFFAERINDGDTMHAAFYQDHALHTQAMSKMYAAAHQQAFRLKRQLAPSRGWFGLTFANSKSINKVVIHHGIRLQDREDCLNVADSFELQYLEGNRWRTIGSTVTKDSDQLCTVHVFNPVTTTGLRILIHSQCFQRQRYASGEEWRWWLEKPEQTVDDLFPNITGVKKDLGGMIDNEVISDFIADEQDFFAEFSAKPFFMHFLRFGYADHIQHTVDRRQMMADRSLAKKFGNNFLGFLLYEWDSDFWHEMDGPGYHILFRKVPKALPALPKTRKKAVEILRDAYETYRKLHFNKAVGMNNHVLLDHYQLEWGADATCIEISGNGDPSHQIQIASARGAARQYNRMFHCYLAFCLGTSNPNYLKPRTGFTDHKPEGGVSPSLHRRMLFYSYMSGASTIMHESQLYSLVGYSKEKQQFELAPHGTSLRELHEFQKKLPSRGVAYTPVGLLLDWLHGWGPPCVTGTGFGVGGHNTWFDFPYRDADHMLERFLHMLFPCTLLREERNGHSLVNAPFGDIFDILVANPPSGPVQTSLLSNYKVLIIPGELSIDSRLKQQLVDYVKRGGSLVLNSIHAGIFAPSFLGFKSSSTVKRSRSVVSGITGKEFSSTVFEYPGIELQNAKALYKTKRGDALVTENAMEKGRVITTLPYYGLDKDKQLLPLMHELVRYLTSEVLPVQVEGDIQYLLSRTDTAWIVTLINNKGVYKQLKSKERIVKDEYSDVCIKCSGTVHGRETLKNRVIQVNYDAGTTSLSLRVPPGEICIVELTSKNKLTAQE